MKLISKPLQNFFLWDCLGQNGQCVPRSGCAAHHPHGNKEILSERPSAVLRDALRKFSASGQKLQPNKKKTRSSIMIGLAHDSKVKFGKDAIKFIQKIGLDSYQLGICHGSY